MEGNEKIGLDDFLCNHSVDELKQLPAHEFRKHTLDEMIKDATKDIAEDDLHIVIQRLAYIEKDTERSLYINKLHEKTNISKTAIKNEIKKTQGRNAFRDKNLNCGTEEDSSNNIIVHPSYEVNEEFISIGYRERVVVNDGNDIPKLEDQNLYIMSVHNKILVHKKSIILEHLDNKIIFDVGSRVLLEVGTKWGKEMINDFVDNPTTPSGCFYKIKELLREHVEFSKECIYGLLSAWIIATYFYQIFDAFPFLLILGKKGCGKSRLLDILERLSFNAIKTKGVTVAALSDTTDGIRGTFLIDQAESLSNPDNGEMVGILADSYSRGGGKRRVVDMSSKGRKVLEFETYSPKVFATYKNIHYDLRDRCIEMVMLRGENDFPYPKASSPIWREMRDELYRLLLTQWKEVVKIYPQTGMHVKNRVKELWQPIETVLKLENISNEEVNSIKTFFDESMQETQTELTEMEIELFEAFGRLLKENQKRVLTSTDIAKELRSEFDGMEAKEKKSLQTWVGSRAKQLGLHSKAAGRVDKKRAYEYDYKQVMNIFKRHSPEIGGLGGQVVCDVKTKGFMTSHRESTGGNEVVNEKNNTTCTTFVPPLKDEMVIPKSLESKDDDHLTTCLDSDSENDISMKEKAVIDLENEEVAIIG
jgi:hypothetical protein